MSCSTCMGVVWITAAFPAYIMLVRRFVVGDANADMSLGVVSAAEITAGIAAAHTGFNVTNTIVFLPLAGYMASLLQRLIPDKERSVDEQEHLTNLDIRMLESPVVAVEQSRVEVLRMADACKQMMIWLKELLQGDTPDEELTKKILEMEQEQDAMQNEIVTFMSNLLVGNIPHNVVDEARRQLRLADEYESISDCIASILKANRHLHRHGMRLPHDQQAELYELHDMVADYLEQVSQYYKQSGRTDVATEMIPQGEIDHEAREGVVQAIAGQNASRSKSIHVRWSPTIAPSRPTAEFAITSSTSPKHWRERSRAASRLRASGLGRSPATPFAGQNDGRFPVCSGDIRRRCPASGVAGLQAFSPTPKPDVLNCARYSVRET